MLRKLNSLMLPWPADWTALFGADRPLIVEIGFGQGAFLLHLARQHPDANVIGFEIANRCLLKAESKIERAKLTNVRVVHSMAETALHHLFTPASIWQVHVNFPDPWFKKSHERRRLIRRDTLDALVNRLVPGGEFYLATDIHAYAEMADELLRDTPGLDNCLPGAWANQQPGRITTKYEATARREGRVCYYFAYRRNHQPAPEVPVIKDRTMPHVVFTSPLAAADMAARFEPQKYHQGGTSIHLMDAYLGRGTVLVETHVGEPTITQHVALLIVERERAETDAPHEYTIQLSTLGQPRPTSGIHTAVRLLADWVLALDPENKVLKQKVSLES